MKALTTEQFIEKARKVHGDKFDYSKVKYTNNRTKICIICPEHGEFWQTPCDHLNSKGCLRCSGKFLKTTNQFKQEIIEKYGDKYDLSKVEYKGAFVKVCIICHEKDELGNEHGEFWIIPTNFLRGKQCPKCSKAYCPTTKEWVERVKFVHNNKYDYSKVNYVDNSTKVCIICHEKDELGNEHGEFWQSPCSHLQSKCGCPKCANKYIPTTKEWIERAKFIHNDKYDYSKVNYAGSGKKVCIICPEHGEFWQTAGSHLSGKGCALCVGNVQKTNEQFINEANIIHENKYKYEHCEYINNHTKIIITCPIHGDFKQMPNSHLRGAGCPECYFADKHLSETKILKKLKALYPNVEYQKRFDWLGWQSLDFYLPYYNVGIEYQGRQHFSDDTYFYKNERDIIIERDERKIKLCAEHGVKLFHLTFEDKYIPEDFDIYPLYTSLKDVLFEISKMKKE